VRRLAGGEPEQRRAALGQVKIVTTRPLVFARNRFIPGIEGSTPMQARCHPGAKRNGLVMRVDQEQERLTRIGSSKLRDVAGVAADSMPR
jgi:hypothetical protein